MKNYHITFVAIAFILGIIIASFGIFQDVPYYLLAIFVLILFISLLLSIKKDFLFSAIIFLLVFMLGAIRYSIFNIIDENHIRVYTPYLQKKVLIQGEVVSDPEYEQIKNRETFILETESIKLDKNWKIIYGLVLVNIDKSEDFYKYGDIVVLEGFLKQPFIYKRRANFDYRKFLANKKIYSMLNVKKDFFSKKIDEDKRIKTQILKNIYSIRSKLETHIEGFLKAPYNAVLIAILLGKRGSISSSLIDIFAKTGTLHILAISGLHVGVIYFMLRIILKILRTKKNISIMLSILFLICYTILTGARPSILRATTMFSIFGSSEILKRKVNIYNLIGLSCLIILAINPNQVFDIGFILSYAAVLSIVSIAPKFYQPFSMKNRFGYYLLKSIAVSLGVWIGLLPLIAYYFGLISPVIVIANLIVIPLLFLVMGSGLLFISFGLLSKFLATIFAQSIWLFLFMLLNCIKFLKNIPGSFFEINPPRVYSIIFYYILLVILLNYKRVKKLTFSFLT